MSRGKKKESLASYTVLIQSLLCGAESRRVCSYVCADLRKANLQKRGSMEPMEPPLDPPLGFNRF